MQLAWRAVDLLQTEGLAGLVADVLRHADVVRRSILCLERCVVYRFETGVAASRVTISSIGGPGVEVLERDGDLSTGIVKCLPDAGNGLPAARRHSMPSLGAG